MITSPRHWLTVQDLYGLPPVCPFLCLYVLHQSQAGNLQRLAGGLAHPARAALLGMSPHPFILFDLFERQLLRENE